jgi:nitrogen-specific signal transduction histidine kinase
MMKPDPLLHKERQAIADELTSSMRHDVRNRLSTIRNAAFYIKRRVSQTELWTSDARVQQFFALIDESVAHAERLLTAKFGARTLDGAELAPTTAAGALAKAVASARVAPGITFDVHVDEADVYVDADELALGVRCLLESAAAALTPPGVVSVRAMRTPTGYAVEVSPWGGASAVAEADGKSPGERWEEGGDGLGVHLAARVARCYGGSLETSSAPAGGGVSLTVPLEPHESPELPPAAR